MARQGGIGVVHKNMSIEDQAEHVDRVKRSESGVITNPFSLTADHQVFDAEAPDGRNIGFPVYRLLTGDHKLVGILTNRDLRFIEDYSHQISEVMTQ